MLHFLFIHKATKKNFVTLELTRKDPFQHILMLLQYIKHIETDTHHESILEGIY